MISPFISDIVQLLDRHMRLLDRVGSDEWNYKTLTFAECIKCLITYTKFNKFLNVFTSTEFVWLNLNLFLVGNLLSISVLSLTLKLVFKNCTVPDLELNIQEVTVHDLEIDLQECYCH